MTKKIWGYVLALAASLLWGVSGTFAQFLFQSKDLTAEWLVTVRLLVAGSLLLGISALRDHRQMMAPLKVRRDFLDLMGFGILGMLAVQYTFFATIKHSNAATATVLQYLGPVIIACYYSVIEKRVPLPREVAAIFLAVLGTFLIVTHGSLESLSISPEAFSWGLLSAIALATYSILPIRLLHKYEASVVVGWGMLFGGVIFSILYRPWDIPGHWDAQTYFSVLFIIIFGTASAFYSYLLAVKKIGATITSLLACAEPLSAALIAVFWLNVSYGFFDWVGTACILLTIIFLTTFEGHLSAQ